MAKDNVGVGEELKVEMVEMASPPKPFKVNVLFEHPVEITWITTDGRILSTQTVEYPK